MTFEMKPKLTYPSITDSPFVRPRASWAVSFAIILAFIAFCCVPGAYAGTVTGQIRTATGGTINRGTLTLNLSQPMIQALSAIPGLMAEAWGCDAPFGARLSASKRKVAGAAGEPDFSPDSLSATEGRRRGHRPARQSRQIPNSAFVQVDDIGAR